MEFKNSGPRARPDQIEPIDRRTRSKSKSWGMSESKKSSNFLRTCTKAARKANPGRINGGERFFCKAVGAATAGALGASMAVLAAGWLTVLPPAGRYFGL